MPGDRRQETGKCYRSFLQRLSAMIASTTTIFAGSKLLSFLSSAIVFFSTFILTRRKSHRKIQVIILCCFSRKKRQSVYRKIPLPYQSSVLPHQVIPLALSVECASAPSVASFGKDNSITNVLSSLSQLKKEQNTFKVYKMWLTTCIQGLGLYL